MNKKELMDLKLKGYVTPGSVTGRSDAARLQRALDLAVKEDIRKVIVDEDLKLTKTVKLPAGVEVKFAKNVKVESSAKVMFVNETATCPEKASWSFEDRWIFLLAEEGAELKGNIRFYHAGNLVLEDLKLDGTVTFEFSREVRMERNEITAPKGAAVKLMRGCNNYIIQYNTFTAKKNAVVVDAALEEGAYVVGKDTDIHEIIIRNNRMEAANALFAGASEESGVFNMQYDYTKTEGNGIVIGRRGEKLDRKRYFNISSCNHTCGKKDRILNNEVKHCFFGE